MSSTTMPNTPTVVVERKRRPKKTPLFLRVVRASFRFIGPILPGPMGRWAFKLWFRPRRHQRPDQETAFLSTANRHYRSDIEGENIAVFSWGKGPAILLVHGWAGRCSQLRAFVKPLVDKGFRVVTFDFPGHGESSGTITNADQINKIVVELDNREGGFEGILSHSFGGVVTSLSIRRGLGVKRSVMICSPCRFQDMLGLFQGMLHIPNRAMTVMKNKTRDYFTVPEGDVLTNVDSDINLRGSSVKGLLIHDEEDREVPINQSEMIMKAWTNARLMRTRGLGHNRILRDESVVGEAVAFLAGETK